jgi:hypothetical protein
MQREFNRLKIKDYVSTLSQMPYESELEYNQRRIATILNVPIEYIANLPYSIYTDYLVELKNIEDNIRGFKVKDKVKIGKTWYKIDTDIMKITAAQFIDASAFSKEVQKDLHKFLAVFLRPMTWRFGKVANYDGKRHKEISESVYENMTMKDAQPFLVFFCKVLQELSTHIGTYLLEEVEMIVKDLQRSGAISSQSTTFQTEMLPSGTTSLI